MPKQLPSPPCLVHLLPERSICNSVVTRGGLAIVGDAWLVIRLNRKHLYIFK